jgi:large subunit ribosomal protein L18
MYGQLVDDLEHRTLASSNSMKINKGTKTEKSKECGMLLAEAAKKNKIKQVVFDRGGNKYHGRIKAFAEGAREGGLEF